MQLLKHKLIFGDSTPTPLWAIPVCGLCVWILVPPRTPIKVSKTTICPSHKPKGIFMYFDIVERLKNQLIDQGTPENHAGRYAINILKKSGILDDNGLTLKGKVREIMTPEQRAIDRVRGKRSFTDYQYNPTTNRATLKR